MIFSVIFTDNSAFAEENAVYHQQEQTGQEKEIPEQTEQETDPSAASASGDTDDGGFDENQPFTLAMLDEVDSYTMDMDQTIDFDRYFELEAETDDGEDCTEDCELHFPENPQTIHGGEISQNVPALAYNRNDAEHIYAYAHVGQTPVYYIGNLTIYDGGAEKAYIFYTTDRQIDKKTVYAVLKENEKIALVYQHGTYHSIHYELVNADGEVSPQDVANGWTADRVFGADRVRAVADSDSFNGTVEIPRGYTAYVTVKDVSDRELHRGELGKMMRYSYDTGKPNTITPDEGNASALRFTDSFGIRQVTSDVTVTVSYRKIRSYTFNAYYWSQTAKAGGPTNRPARISINDKQEMPSEQNCKLSFDDEKNSVTWKFHGITSGGYTWEMNQLEINGEPINVPMVALASNGAAAEATTVLSTGTIIRMTVTSKGGTEGGTGRREYTLTAENCCEDLTVSAGNMVGNIHREFANRALIGVEEAQYFHGLKDHPDAFWWDLKQNTLIDKRNGSSDGKYTYDIAAPFRLKTAPGYGKLNVTFTDKESKVLQTNGELNQEVTKEKFIEYLIRTDTGNSGDEKAKGVYQEVPYEDWTPSEDGYYYCRATKALDTFMQKNTKNGVILLWFYADVERYGIDYQNGAGDGQTAPLAEQITSMPGYQNGGDKGYNMINNTKALVSNSFPVDSKGNFIFDHWEILLVKNGEVTNDPKENITDEQGDFIPNHLEAGATVPLSKGALEHLGDCIYYNEARQRNTLTLRAVWKKRDLQDPITYTVNYYLTEVQGGALVNPRLIEEHNHTVNSGAMLVSDLWQDAQKTLSPVIREILAGNNDLHTDFTYGGKTSWIIYEPETTKVIYQVSETDNVANIYLVKQPKLSVSKEVKGALGDLTKAFRFTVEVKDENGNPYSGMYHCTGSVLPDISGVKAPADETLTLTDGKAEFWLSHGQQITFTDLPFGCVYTVTEETAEGYTTVYNDDEAAENAAGTLEADADISVVNTKTDVPVTGITDDRNRFGKIAAIGAGALLLLFLTELRRRKA